MNTTFAIKHGSNYASTGGIRRMYALDMRKEICAGMLQSDPLREKRICASYEPGTQNSFSAKVVLRILVVVIVVAIVVVAVVLLVVAVVAAIVVARPPQSRRRPPATPPAVARRSCCPTNDNVTTS